MASQTPCALADADPSRAGSSDDDASANATESEYRSAWGAISRLMKSGASWSGGERNCAYLNLGDGTYLDISFVAGLDQADDARSVLTADLDGDGDQDLVLRNRTAPQVRIFERLLPEPRPYVALRLEGRASNRDAVGAVVEASVSGRRIVRRVACGSGYLAQSSKEILLPLAEGTRVDELAIRWPTGTRQEYGAIEAGRYRCVETEDIEPFAYGERPDWTEQMAPVQRVDGESARLVLRSPLPLPQTLRTELGGDPAPGRVRLVVLWASWCERCRAELDQFAAHASELEDAGVELLCLNVDEPDQRVAARELFETRWRAGFDAARPGLARAGYPSGMQRKSLAALLDCVLVERDDGRLPTSLLFDSGGSLQVVYRGPAGVEGLAADARAYSSPRGGPRVSYPGFWLFQMRRDTSSLASDLERNGLQREAAFYRAVDRLRGAAEDGGR